jgi:hypothetical protein
MITMNVKISRDLDKILNELPMLVQFKCVDSAARKMIPPIVRATQAVVQPDSASSTGTQRWSQDAVPPKQKWSASAKQKYDTGPSAPHVVGRYWKNARGGIVYIGMNAMGKGPGKKMHFRIPVVKRSRTLYYWGKPGQIISQRSRYGQIITYTRGSPKKPGSTEAEKAAGSKLPIERAYYLKRAYERAFHQAMSLFKNEFYKKAKGLHFG